MKDDASDSGLEFSDGEDDTGGLDDLFCFFFCWAAPTLPLGISERLGIVTIESIL